MLNLSGKRTEKLDSFHAEQSLGTAVFVLERIFRKQEDNYVRKTH